MTTAEEFVDAAEDEGKLKAEIAKLAALPKGLYAQRRKPEAKRLGMPVAELDLLVKAERAKKAKKPTTQFDPDELECSASYIIKHPDILTLFAQDFSKIVAGEEANGKLLYLVATSRLFDKPMSAALKGTSAVGKSEVRKRILGFIPPESIVSFTSLSEKALIYYEGDFAHKILSMGEAAATDEQKFQDYLIRELLSEGRIRHSTAQKVGNEIQQITIEKNGPVAFLVTTTRNKLNPENETRMLSLEIDDSPDQTKKVLNKVAQVDGLHAVTSIDYRPWLDFQRWLELGERRVVVPFAAAMAQLIPAEAVRLRRDFGQVIRAIKAHALLHRQQRNRDDAGRIVADIEYDYTAVCDLLSKIVAEGSGAAVSKAMTATIDAVAKATLGMAETAGANAKQIAKLLKLDRSAAWRRLTAACDEGYVVNLEQRERLPGKYRVTGQKVEPVKILPTAEELNEKYSPPTPPETVHSCNRDEIDEVFLGDNECTDECKPSAECAEPSARVQPSANGLALDKSLNGNEKSPPVARVHGFQGGLTGETRFAPVCEHCGGPATPSSPVQLCAAAGEEFLLHRDCQAEWLGKASNQGVKQ